MGFTKRISSCDDVKRFVSSTDGAVNEPVGLHIEKMGPICKTRKNSAAATSHGDQSFVKDGDIDLVIMERCLDDDDNECTWLSSDFMSPSSFFEEHRLSAAAPFHLSDDDCLVSWLSTLSPGNDFEIDFAVSSLVNLDGEDSEWISDTDSEFQSDFPSPTYKTKSFAQVKDKASQEAADLEDFGGGGGAAAADEELLFWPFDRDQDWSSEEDWKCFSMSPRKDMAGLESSGVLQFHDRKMNPESGCRSWRKPVFFSGLTAATKILELKQRASSGNKGVKKIKALPSRLRNSDKVSAKLVPLETENEHTTKPTKMKVIVSKPFCTDDFAFNEELSIESVLGLC